MSKIVVTPTAGKAGTKVTVTGSGFPARKQILVTVGRNIVASTTSTILGRINTTFQMPSVVPGKTIIRTAVAQSAAAAFTVAASGSAAYKYKD